MASSFNVDNLNMEPKFEISIAIDFGTDGMGVAYALPESNEIHVHDKWKSKKYGTIVKPKTIILFDENFEVVNVGLDAKHAYMDLPNQRDTWMLFERFKMKLFEDNLSENNEDEKKERNEEAMQRVTIRDELTAINDKKCSAEQVFVKAFEKVDELCMTYLKREKIKICRDNIQWIITVPAIWTDESKNKMKGWAIKAGLVNENINNQCRIVYEPDCASLAIQYHMKDRGNIHYDQTKKKKKGKKKKGKKNKKKMDDNVDEEYDNKYIMNDELDLIDDSYNLENGDKYILIDAGGGTVDIACHQVIDEFGVKEIYHPSGGKWGSTYIDDQYVKLLQKIFSKQWIKEFKKQKANQYVQLIYNFQQSKETFYSSKLNKKHNVELTLEFCAFIEQELTKKYTASNVDDNDEDQMYEVLRQTNDGEYVECFVKNHKINDTKSLIEFEDGYLVIDHVVWTQMFDFVMDPMIAHVQHLLDDVPLLMSKKLKFICLVGGLSCSKYFQFRIKHTFGLKSKYKLGVIIPQKPILSVVQGAAFLGITPNFVRARKLRKTYGICMNFKKKNAKQIGISDSYIEENTLFDGYVRNCFKVIAHKKEEIHVHQVKKATGKRRSTATCVQILCSYEENPLIASDGKVLAVYILECNDDENDQIVTEFHFYDTLLKAYSYPIDKPDNRKGVEISYQE